MPNFLGAAIFQTNSRSLSAFYIGGIKMENLPEVLAAGARRCVIVSQFLTAADVKKATAEAKRALS